MRYTDDAKEYINMMEETRRKMKAVSDAEHHLRKASIGLSTILRELERTREYQDASEANQAVQKAADCLYQISTDAIRSMKNG
jgi:hypothetical protein